MDLLRQMANCFLTLKLLWKENINYGLTLTCIQELTILIAIELPCEAWHLAQQQE